MKQQSSNVLQNSQTISFDDLQLCQPQFNPFVTETQKLQAQIKLNLISNQNISQSFKQNRIQLKSKQRPNALGVSWGFNSKSQCQTRFSLQSSMSQTEIDPLSQDLRKSLMNKSSCSYRFQNIKTLTQSDVFKCHTCQDKNDKNCCICFGKKQLTGTDKIIKFFEYILEFKIGIKQSYRPQKKYPKRNSVNDHLNVYFSTYAQQQDNSPSSPPPYNRLSLSSDQRIISQMQLEQKLKQNTQVHYDFFCDNCQCNPIIGARYHCKQCQNQGDSYDLCQQCFVRKGHRHSMDRVQLRNSSLLRVSNLMQSQKCGGDMKCLKKARNWIRNTNIINKATKSSIR